MGHRTVWTCCLCDDDDMYSLCDLGNCMRNATLIFLQLNLIYIKSPFSEQNLVISG